MARPISERGWMVNQLHEKLSIVDSRGERIRILKAALNDLLQESREIQNGQRNERNEKIRQDINERRLKGKASKASV